MSGKQLYDLWVEEMEACQTDPFDSWDDLNIAVQQAWERLATRVRDLERE